MSQDEQALLVTSLVIAAIVWGAWFLRGSRLSGLVVRAGDRRVLYLAPLACTVGLFAVLRAWSAEDVRNDGRYLFFYQAIGAAWVGGAALFFPLFGISVRDDVLERRNRAAGCALGGALLGITACFAGGNIGSGPGWWIVLFCALLSTGALFLVWSIHERVTHVSEAITLERDAASGLRLSGFLIAVGLVFGRAVAGDWSSVAEATNDFLRLSWPALALLALALLLDRQLAPTRDTPRPALLTHGLVPGLFYLSAAIAWAIWIGPWS